jgi:hypothetical protein
VSAEDTAGCGAKMLPAVTCCAARNRARAPRVCQGLCLTGRAWCTCLAHTANRAQPPELFVPVGVVGPI